MRGSMLECSPRPLLLRVLMNFSAFSVLNPPSNSPRLTNPRNPRNPAAPNSNLKCLNFKSIPPPRPPSLSRIFKL